MDKCFYCEGNAPHIVSAEIEIKLTGLPEQSGFPLILSARICPGCMYRIREDTHWCFALLEKEEEE